METTFLTQQRQLWGARSLNEACKATEAIQRHRLSLRDEDGRVCEL